MLTKTNFFNLIVFVVIFCLYDQPNIKEQQFKTAVQEVINAFSKQDSLKLSKRINKETGVYQLIRIGVFDNYEHYKTLSFSDSTAEKAFFTDLKGIKFSLLKYSRLPTFNCETEVWNKKGLFVDTTKTDHILSKICKERNKYVPDNIPAKTIQFFYNLENKSRRIILYDNNGKELVFYLSYLKGKWYLTIIDNVTSDCSA